MYELTTVGIESSHAQRRRMVRFSGSDSELPLKVGVPEPRDKDLQNI